MAEAVYGLCALTSIICALLLLRGYLAARSSLLFWACLCFAGLALNNIVLFIDILYPPEGDLAMVRGYIALGSMMLLLVGLIWD